MRKLFIIKSIFVFLLALSMTASAADTLKEKSGIKYKDIKRGAGVEAVPNKVVTVSLAMWTVTKGAKGKKLFDSNDAGSRIISFKLVTDSMPDGLNIGINGMRVGGIRRLYVPPELNPKTGSGDFPGNATLIYEVELLEVK
jgi:FKBP-type peptidyl-prolyl cis-trans isomerase